MHGDFQDYESTVVKAVACHELFMDFLQTSHRFFSLAECGVDASFQPTASSHLGNETQVLSQSLDFLQPVCGLAYTPEFENVDESTERQHEEVIQVPCFPDVLLGFIEYDQRLFVISSFFDRPSPNAVHIRMLTSI